MNPKIEAKNRELDAKNVQRWAECPDKFVVYYEFPEEKGGGIWRDRFNPRTRDAYVSTWMGAKLGVITSAVVHTNNMRARIVTVRVQGNNGARYYGAAGWDSGNSIVLRKVKR